MKATINPVSCGALAFGAMTVAASAAQVQNGATPPNTAVTIPLTAVHTLHAPQIDADFQIWIAEPVSGVVSMSPGPLNVLYVLDANLFFGTAVEMTRIMHQLFGELPPLLVVGIAYDTELPSVQAELRARDFTPTGVAGFVEMARNLPGAPEPTLPPGRRLGGAPAFLSFLETEVRPFIEERFDVAEGRSTLFGSSLGGLFALYAFLSDPGGFDAYIAASPAIWWDDSMLFGLEEDLAASGTSVETAVVLAVGSEEERTDIPMLAQFKMITNMGTMAERLTSRGYAGLSLSTLVLEGESHTSVVPVALTRGLRRIFHR